MHGGREPGPDHPITIERADQRVIVRTGDTILAESVNALLLREASYPPVIYIPREEVAMRELEASATSTHCPYKGDASYFSVVDGDARDVAWSYETRSTAWRPSAAPRLLPRPGGRDRDRAEGLTFDHSERSNPATV